MRCWGRFMHQFHVAVGASSKPLPILRFALWTIHSAPSLLHLGLPTHPAGGRNLPAAPPASLSPQIYLQLYLDKYGTYMVIYSLIVSRQHNRFVPCSRLPASSQVTKSPVVHPLLVQPLTKCFFRNSFVLKTIHLPWGVYPRVYPLGVPPWVCPRSLFTSTQLPILIFPISYPFFFHTLAHSFALFCTHAKLNSFLFLRFRTLREKLPGVGYPSK